MAGLPILDVTSERGVHNPRVIDLIAFDAETDEVVVTMIEFRPWKNDPTQLEELEEKCNNYADYILDGHLTAQYPQYLNKKVRIELRCATDPVGESVSLINAMDQFLASVNVGFIARIGDLDAPDTFESAQATAVRPENEQ